MCMFLLVMGMFSCIEYKAPKKPDCGNSQTEYLSGYTNGSNARGMGTAPNANGNNDCYNEGYDDGFYGGESKYINKAKKAEEDKLQNRMYDDLH